MVTLTSPDPVAAFTLAVEHDPALLTFQGAGVSPQLESLGIEFFSVSPFTGGIAVGAILDLLAPLDGQVIPPGADFPVVTLDYRATDRAAGITTTSLEFAGGVLGDPPLGNLIVDATGSEIQPTLVSGAVRIVPPRGPRVPGDCNQDGSLDVSDAACVFGVIFLARPARFPCGDGSSTAPGNVTLLDWQGDGFIDLGDGVGVLLALFLGGPPHPLALPGRELDGCVPVPGCAASDACR